MNIVDILMVFHIAKLISVNGIYNYLKTIDKHYFG